MTATYAANEIGKGISKFARPFGWGLLCNCRKIGDDIAQRAEIDAGRSSSAVPRASRPATTT
jgi:nitrogenase subunit NifH